MLLVSHNLGTVASFCRSGLLLEEGRLAAQGPIGGRGADAYVRSLENAARRTPRAERPLCEGRVALRPRTWKGVVDSGSSLAAGEPARFIFEVSTCPGLQCPSPSMTKGQ